MLAVMLAAGCLGLLVAIAVSKPSVDEGLAIFVLSGIVVWPVLSLLGTLDVAYGALVLFWAVYVVGYAIFWSPWTLFTAVLYGLLVFVTLGALSTLPQLLR
jgi:hypothetical protein